MDDIKLSANAPQDAQDDVEGHGRVAGKAVPDTDDAEVEGHAARAGRAVPDADEPEVEGNGRTPGRAIPEVAGESEVEGHSIRNGRAVEHEDTDAEVEGHMHGMLAPDVARAIDNDRMAQAERDARAAGASGDRDGGILDKIRRYTER